MKRKLLIILSVFSTLGVLSWIITDFFGGMVIYFIMYKWIVLTFIFTYVLTILITIISIIIKGIKPNKVLLFNHVIGILLITVFCLYQTELFKSRIILDATLEDDLSSINIVLRENGHFNTTSMGMLGSKELMSGKYLIKKDTLVFIDKPYLNDFIPAKVLIDRKDSAIFFRKQANGEFSHEKMFAAFFNLNKIELK